MDENKLYKALKCFDISISLDSNYYFPIANAALVNSILGNVPKSKKYAYKAYTLKPKLSFTNYVFGKVYSEAKDYSNAVKYFSKSIENANQNEKMNHLHQYYLKRAIANAWLKKDVDAEYDYKKCLDLNRKNHNALFWYGNFLVIRKRKNESCYYFKRLYNLKPDYTNSGYTVSQMLRYNECD